MLKRIATLLIAIYLVYFSNKQVFKCRKYILDRKKMYGLTLKEKTWNGSTGFE